MQMNRQKNSNQSGFSLLELLVTMVLMLIVLGSAFALLRGSIIAANANYEMTDAQQALRIAHEYISRDLLKAGDGVRDVQNVYFPTNFVSKYMSSRPVSELDPNGTGFYSAGLINSDFNVPDGIAIEGSDPLINIKQRTDRITILAIDNTFVPIDVPAYNSDYNTGKITISGGYDGIIDEREIYCLSNGTDATFLTVTSLENGNQIVAAQGDDLGLNYSGYTGNIATVTKQNSYPTVLMRVNIIQYFIDADGRLIRRVLGVKGEPYSDSVIAEHLVNLKFRYILNPAADGSEILTQPKEQLDTSEQRLMVRMVEAALSVETANPLQDGVVHQVEGTNQVAVRNMQYAKSVIPVDNLGTANVPLPGPPPVMTPPTPLPTPTSVPEPSPSPSPLPPPPPIPTATPYVPAPPTVVPTATTPVTTPTIVVPTATPIPTPVVGDLDG